MADDVLINKAATIERCVKRAREEYDRRAPFAAPKVMQLVSLGRVKPSEAEVKGNPRSRSAIMRVAQRTVA